MLNSLLSRLMTFSAITLLLLMAGIGLLLEHAFYLTQVKGMQERLKIHSYSILSVAEFQQHQLYLPHYLQERRFNKQQSGLYAQVVNQQSQPVWTSRSAAGVPVSTASWAQQGQWLYSTVSNGNEQHLLARYGVSWSESGRPGPVFNVVLIESMVELEQQVGDYRQTLAILLAALAAFILLIQYLILRWGLKPLNQVSDELQRLQHGEQSELDADYPSELRPLTSNLNRLIISERAQRERYRNTMADLSHSLKTPLTVMSGIVRDAEKTERQELLELQQQIDKMNSTIRYQLQRAVSGAQGLTVQSVAVLPLLQQICQAMDKVYAEKRLVLHLDVDEKISFNGDENDLMEILGNLVDNACKYGSQVVEISAGYQSGDMWIQVCDDGPGIAEDQYQTILQRGQRLDTVQPGQGLGLALVKEIIDSYAARLSIGRSQLGGACFKAEFNRHRETSDA